MHQFRKPTLWHLIICYFHSSGMSCRRVIQAESSSSNPDVGHFFLVSLRSCNQIIWSAGVKFAREGSRENFSLAPGTNARHFLGICGSCWFQQDGATVHTTTRARSWLKSRFGGEVISRLTNHPWPARPWVWTCPPPPLDLVLERGHDRAQKDPHHHHHVSWAERNHRVLRPVNGRRSQTGGTGTRRRACACLERNGAAFEERQEWVW